MVSKTVSTLSGPFAEGVWAHRLLPSRNAKKSRRTPGNRFRMRICFNTATGLPASKSANKITNVAKSSLGANAAIRHKAFAKLQRLTGRRWLFVRKGGETQVRFLRCG